MSWVAVVDSAAVPVGAVVGVVVDGRELVVWRGGGGAVAACDARCPHQWSHLAAEGAVDGDELVCLSHFWRFDASGRGSKVNVKGRRDDKGPVVAFACRERDGQVQVEVP